MNSYDVEIIYKTNNGFDTLYPQTVDNNVLLSDEALEVFEGETVGDALVELKRMVPSLVVAEQGTPVITVDENGLITATVTQQAGYVKAGSKTGTYNISSPGNMQPTINFDTNTGLVTSTASPTSGFTSGYTAGNTYQIAQTTQASPSVSVNTSGLITGSITQSSGWLTSGATKTAMKQLSTQSSTTWTPGTSNKTIASSGTYLTGTQTIKGDSNLVSSNIKSGVSIFGVTGNFVGSSENSQIYTWQRAVTINLTNNSGDTYVVLAPPQSVINSNNVAIFSSNTPIGLDFIEVTSHNTVSFKLYGSPIGTSPSYRNFFVLRTSSFTETIKITSSSSGVVYEDHSWGYLEIGITSTTTATQNITVSAGRPDE